jgi:prepilin-type N-terminal cleavage/methylation domain-containing protein
MYMKATKLQMKAKGGFTLIEILVVIGIIAVLATIVLIAINPARQFAQANDTQRVSNTNAILNAIGQYMADNHGDLPADVDAGMEEVTAALCNDLVPTYMPAMPTDPDSTNDGKSVACSEVGSAGEVKYEIGTTGSSTAQRVMVSAPEAELTTPIEVTR